MRSAMLRAPIYKAIHRAHRLVGVEAMAAIHRRQVKDRFGDDPVDFLGAFARPAA
jgi:hypothetical protein